MSVTKPNKTNLSGATTQGMFKTALDVLVEYVNSLTGADGVKRASALPIDEGGTNATTAAGARAALGLDGMRNKIINGNFSVNQRAVTGTVVLSAGAYGHDRWKAGASGCTYTFATVENVTTITITAGSLLQIIEGLNLFTGTHILSWAGTAQGKIGAGSYSASGVTGTVTGGTNLTIEFGTGTLALVQFEQGSVATPFESRNLAQENLLCCRYFCTLNSSTGAYPATPAILAMSYTAGDTNRSQRINFPVPMRAIPSINMTAATASRYICASSIGPVVVPDATASATAIDQFGFNLQNVAVGGGATWTVGWIDNFGILTASAEI